MFDLLQFVLLYLQICTRPVSTLRAQISTWVQMVIWRSPLMRHETQRHPTCCLSFSRRQGKTRRAACLHTTPDAASLLGIDFWIRKRACDWKEQPSQLANQHAGRNTAMLFGSRDLQTFPVFSTVFKFLDTIIWLWKQKYIYLFEPTNSG
jgi:hypothetical protein